MLESSAMWYVRADSCYKKMQCVRTAQGTQVYMLCVQVYSYLLWCLLDCLYQTYPQGSAALLHMVCIFPEGGFTAYDEAKGTDTRLRNKNKARSRLALSNPRKRF